MACAIQWKMWSERELLKSITACLFFNMHSNTRRPFRVRIWLQSTAVFPFCPFYSVHFCEHAFLCLNSAWVCVCVCEILEPHLETIRVWDPVTFSLPQKLGVRFKTNTKFTHSRLQENYQSCRLLQLLSLSLSDVDAITHTCTTSINQHLHVQFYPCPGRVQSKVH